VRDQLISDKAKTVQEELETWAKENSILQPGERIVFSIRIELIPTVIEEKQLVKSPFDVPNKYLDMLALEFFLRDNLKDLGVQKDSMATRIVTCIRYEIDFTYKENARSVTLREFLKNIDASQLVRLPNFGRHSLESFATALRNAGIEFSTVVVYRGL
jgi:hypothetical protein